MNNINHPQHYNRKGRKECIEEMIEIFGIENVITFCNLNTYKYLYRAGLKIKEIDGQKFLKSEMIKKSKEEDFKKAEWYRDKAESLRKTQEFLNKRKNWKQTVQEHNFQSGIGEILAIEEMSELIQAISKIQRARKGIIGDKKYLELMGNLIEEIADVKIALDQLIYDWDIKEEVDIKEKEKIARTFERIQRGEE